MIRATIALAIICSAALVRLSVLDAAQATTVHPCIQTCPDCLPFCASAPGANLTGAYVPPKP